ncbi:MAG: YihY/virulence factor BrkB family protein [Gammaproteobacteria bacterium]
MARPAQARQEEIERGRLAERPQEIPARGWRDIALRAKDKVSATNLSLAAAGVAFYGLLSIFPALAAGVSIYGLVADPVSIEQQISTLSGVLPKEALGIITGQLHRIAATSSNALSVGLVISVLFALWSASSGVKALMTALNVTYDEPEKRGFLRLNATALLLTLGAIVFAVLSLGLVVALPALLGSLGLGDVARIAVSVLRWPLLAGAVMIGLAVLYRYAPSRDEPRWSWVSPGAILATVLWIIVSGLFSFYVSNFGNYNETYGSIGAVVILLMWLYLTAFIVLVSAALNAEMEHQTEADTTEGAPRPMGARSARMADTLGKRG